MADFIDQASDRAEAELERAIAAARRSAPVDPVTECVECGETPMPGSRFCCIECRDTHDRLERVRRIQGIK